MTFGVGRGRVRSGWWGESVTRSDRRWREVGFESPSPPLASPSRTARWTTRVFL